MFQFQGRFTCRLNPAWLHVTVFDTNGVCEMLVQLVLVYTFWELKSPCIFSRLQIKDYHISLWFKSWSRSFPSLCVANLVASCTILILSSLCSSKIWLDSSVILWGLYSIRAIRYTFLIIVFRRMYCLEGLLFTMNSLFDSFFFY